MAFENLFVRSNGKQIFTDKSIPEGEEQLLSLRFDAILSETHNNKAVLTKNPVEDGASISDHIVIDPVQIVIVAIVSDTQLTSSSVGAAANLLGLTGAAEFEAARAAIAVATTGASLLNRFSSSEETIASISKKAYADLEVLFRAGKPLTVSTKLRLYDNMFIIGMSTAQDVDMSSAVEVSITLEQAIIVYTETDIQPVIIPAKAPTSVQGSTETDTGEQNGGEQPVAKLSVAQKIVDYFTNPKKAAVK